MSVTRDDKARLPSLQQLLLASLFGGLLSISFLDHEKFYLTWVAFVPLLFAVERASATQIYCIGLLAGLVSYVGGMYWIVDFVMLTKGYSASSSLGLASVYWFYCAHLIVFLLLVYKWLKKHTGLHEFLLFPLVVATFTSSYPMLFAMRLGESQINFHAALQALDFFGVHGLDIIIALFNVMLFRGLVVALGQTRKRSFTAKLPWVCAVSVLASWFVYGFIALESWENKIVSWDTLKLGIVQPNEIPSTKNNSIYPGYGRAYPPEMEMSERLSQHGAELIIWPEAQAKTYLDNNNIRNAYSRNISQLGTSLLFQDMQSVRDPKTGSVTSQYNSAVMLDNTGQEAGRYQKMMRIPFGEYVPLVSDDSKIKSWVEGVFGEFINEVSAGKKHQVFKHEKVNIIPLICYETTSPVFVGAAVGITNSDINQSLGSLMVGLSNDGWFGSTHQPYQHIMASVLRAVENRLPLVHVANNGPSIVVAPSGEVIFATDFQQAGGYLAEVPYSRAAQGSFYSRYPNLFDNALLLTLLSVIFLGLARRFSPPRRVD